MTAQSHTVSVAGIETHYLEAGEGEPLVLIHGGGAGADARGNWEGCLAAYARNFHVYAVDMVGFGESARPDPATYNYGQTGRIAHMVAFIETVVGGPAHIIGNSMGGATALGVAIKRPDLLRKLVLMGAAGLDIANPDPSRRAALGGYDYTKEGMRRLVGVLTGPNFKVSDELIDYRHALTMKPGAKAASAAIQEHMRSDPMTYPREDIAGVQTATLVVGGKDDQIAVLARTYGYLELIPNSWGFVLPHTGHWVMMEAPKEFVAVTTAFLAGDMFNA
ncbi:MAG TPA: alpha/beta hydrolase [Caulobacteraceae bacterium]|jgi:pimeloyl-ACP methyl ester carboxylesterase|nr:alpha/beta hydrolase [Caulobacteraceae bacterium]